MKSHRGFFPRKDAEKAQWGKRYKARIGEHGAALGLTPAQIAVQQQAGQQIFDVTMKFFQVQKQYDAAKNERDEVYAEQEKVIGDAVAAFKKNPGFNLAIGAAVGVIGTTKIQDETDLSPLIKTTAQHDHVRINFRKRYTEGISLYCRILGRNEGKFEHLGFCSRSPFKDYRPTEKPGVPEVREYMALCIKNMKEIGQESSISTVTFRGFMSTGNIA
jgi:hypothetical protein